MTQRSVLHKLQLVCLLALISILSSAALDQALSAGTVAGVVLDPNNAAVPYANVTITNSVTGYTRSVTSNTDGTFRFDNVPPNNYQLSVAATGFATAAQNVSVRTSVPINVKIPLAVGGASETVNVTGMNASDALENVSSTHTDVDQNLIQRMPVRQPGNGLSEVVTLAAPGVVADSNGFYHPLGDHAQSTISLDNQPISDQQSKAFSTQIPVNAIQSLEVVTGAAQAETSLVAILAPVLIRESQRVVSMRFTVPSARLMRMLR